MFDLPRPPSHYYPPPPGPVIQHGPGTYPGRGLLGKLFSSSSQFQLPVHAAGAPVSQGMNLGQILGMVQNAQKVIHTIQTVGPIFQQYGPLIKSLPQLVQILNSSSSGSTDDQESANSESEETLDASDEPDLLMNKQETRKRSSVKRIRHQKSLPRMKKQDSANSIPEPKLYV